jgi:hypothetical protein
MTMPPGVAYPDRDAGGVVAGPYATDPGCGGKLLMVTLATLLRVFARVLNRAIR